MYATFTVQDKKMRSVDTIQYLAVTIDAQLSIKDHLLNAGVEA